MTTDQQFLLVEAAGSWYTGNISDSEAYGDDDAFNQFASDESDYSFMPDGESYGSMSYAIPGAPPTPAPTTPVLAGYPDTTGFNQYPEAGFWPMVPVPPPQPAPTPMYQHQAISSQYRFGDTTTRLPGAAWSQNNFTITQAPLPSQTPLSPPPTLPSPPSTDERASKVSRQRRRAIQRDQVRPPRRRKTPPPRVSCDICLKEVADDRSLGRHRWEKHGIPSGSATDDGTGPVCLQKFRCRCGYESPRRSNYLRHLKTCDVRKHVDDKYFRCECGMGHELIDDHQFHIAGCGKKKVGRPSKSDNTETASLSSSLLSRQVSQQSHYTM